MAPTRCSAPRGLSKSPAAIIAARIFESSTAVYRSVVSIDSCPSSTCTARRLRVAVLSSHRDGASINAAAKASGINYRTAQRIVEGAAESRQRQLLAIG